MSENWTLYNVVWCVKVCTCVRVCESFFLSLCVYVYVFVVFVNVFVVLRSDCSAMQWLRGARDGCSLLGDASTLHFARRFKTNPFTKEPKQLQNYYKHRFKKPIQKHQDVPACLFRLKYAGYLGPSYSVWYSGPGHANNRASKIAKLEYKTHLSNVEGRYCFDSVLRWCLILGWGVL